MRPALVLALLLAVATAPLAGQQSRTALARGATLVTNVHVVPMDRDTVLRDHQVLIVDGRIRSVGRRVEAPAGAARIDGGGRWLMPGLIDMHAHLYADEWVPDSVAPYELGVYLANGVTTARLMIGTPTHLALRRDLESGRMTGPQLWIASPQLAGRNDPNSLVVATPEAGRAAVRDAAARGYDFLKLTVLITPEVYDAVADEAKRSGLRLTGHVDTRVGVARALAAGQQIEHFDGFWEALLADSAPMRRSVSDVSAWSVRNWESLDWIDEAKLARLAGLTARSAPVTPTHTFFVETFAAPVPDSVVMGRPDWSHIPPKMRDLYWSARQRFWAAPPTAARRAHYVRIRERLLKGVVDSGGVVFVGSDAPGGLLGYGWTMHRELEHFVRAGLTPYRALRAATVDPAAWLGADAGTIAPGRRADLVLVDGDPLAAISNTARIRAVAIGGTWLPRPTLDRMIAEAGKRLNPGS